MHTQPMLTSTIRRTLRWLIVAAVLLLSLLLGSLAPAFASGAIPW